MSVITSTAGRTGRRNAAADRIAEAWITAVHGLWWGWPT